MRVEVYFNLHKKTFSVRSAKSGKVLLHTDEVHIENPEFVVRQSGRNRVLSEGRKNVHAFVRGDATFFRYTNRPMLDTLIANTLTPKELKEHEPTLIYDSGWKDVQ